MKLAGGEKKNFENRRFFFCFSQRKQKISSVQGKEKGSGETKKKKKKEEKKEKWRHKPLKITVVIWI